MSAGVVFQEDGAHGFHDKLSDLALAMKFHLALGRVDIDVHLAGIEFQKETADRVAALHQGGMIAFDEGTVEAAVFNGASIDEEVLIGSRGAGNAG